MKRLLLLLSLALYADELPRHVLSFWDSKVDKVVDDCLAHRTLEMPLNFLGLDVIYADIHAPLPDLTGRPDIRGILLCFPEATKICNPVAFIDWAIDALDHGKKIVMMGNPGFQVNFEGLYTAEDIQNRLYQKMGFINTQEWVDYPFDYKVQCRKLAPFERNYPDPLPGFYITRVFDGRVSSLLRVGIPGSLETESDLIIIGPQGAFISEFYANNYDPIAYTTNPRGLGWYLDPFAFFAQIFELDTLPVPDVTTLAGRRIFFSSCDGDNWNGGTAIEEYRGKEVSCAEVVLEKIIKPHPEIPMSMGVVAATVDPKWVAHKDSQKMARAYYSLPQVEAASHSYSHPFDWAFFETGGPDKEIPYLHLYPKGAWKWTLPSLPQKKGEPKGYGEQSLTWGYTIPRAFANEPFNLPKEITGAVDYLNQFAPNKVGILLWPGDGRPWDEPVALCYQAEIKQIGGGFTRFDPEYPSLLYVYPLGRKPGGWVQPYAAMNAENSYTEGWTGRFYGFQYLPATLQNTESPRRLKAAQLYYHSYSGEYEASIRAILRNIEFMKTQPYIPIRASSYARIVEGFYSVAFEVLGPSKWKIKERKGLQTIRFDKPQMGVDYSESHGVIGANVHEGSLYVYLDKAVDEPVLAMGASSNGSHLVESSWEIWDVKKTDEGFQFKTQGWGKLFMKWNLGGELREFTFELPQNQETTVSIP